MLSMRSYTLACGLIECVLRHGRILSGAHKIAPWTQGPGDKDLKRRIKQKQSSDEEYELSRYKPLLRTVIEVRLSVSPLVVAHHAR